MRTRLSVCQRKVRFGSRDEAVAAALAATIDLRPYCCDRCRRWHLTSRRKGKRPLTASQPLFPPSSPVATAAVPG